MSLADKRTVFEYKLKNAPSDKEDTLQNPHMPVLN